MIKRAATTVTLLSALLLGSGINMAQAEEGKAAPTACEKKADKKKISDPKKREAYIKKCEKKHKK